jgi:hypothetical protein
MAPPISPSIAGRIYTGKVLMIMGARLSLGLTTFAGWLMLGFAAILGALLANLDSAAKFLSPDVVGNIAKLFTVAVLFYVLQRYSAAVVESSAAVAAEVEKQALPEDMDIRSFFEQLEGATLWPMRYMVRRSNRKILEGDLAAGGRMISTLAQIEAWLVFVQLLLVLAAAWVLADGLRG